MKKPIPLVLLFLTLTACIRTGVGALPTPVPSQAPSPVETVSPLPMPQPSATQTPTPTPIPSAGSVPVMSINTVQSYDSEMKMVMDGLVDVNLVLASDCFRQAVLISNFTENQGLTAGQIYQKLATIPVKINVVMYTGTWWENHVWHTIGKEYEPGTVYINRYFVQTAYMVGDNLIHEGEGHSQGFTHLGTKSTSEPYGMNQIYEKCAPTLGIHP